MKLQLSLLFATSLYLLQPVMAQERRSVRVKAGEDVAKAFSPQGFYRFKTFENAKLYLNTGKRESKLTYNYSLLSGAVQLISPKGDTLDLAEPGLVDSLVFANTKYYYHKPDGFLEEIGKTDSVRLLKSTVIKMQVEDIGAYGMANPTASITNMNRFANGFGVYSFVLNEDVVVVENLQFYWMDNQHILHKATKSKLLQLLPPAKASAAETYLKQNKVNFQKEPDLKKLMAALQMQ